MIYWNLLLLGEINYFYCIFKLFCVVLKYGIYREVILILGYIVIGVIGFYVVDYFYI